MEGWRGGLGNDATLETPTVVDSSVHSRWVWDSTPKCADSSGKQSDGLPRKKNVPASSSPIDNALQKLHRLAGAWPLRRTRARWWSSDAPVARPRATPAFPSPRSAHTASVVRPHAQPEASSRAGNSSIRRVRAREGFRCTPRGSGHRLHREKTRWRRSHGTFTLNRKVHSSRREGPFL